MLNGDTEGAVILPRCSICRQVPRSGIRGGYRLGRGFLCFSCERKIVADEQTEGWLADIKRVVNSLLRFKH